MCLGAGHDPATGPGLGGFRGIVCRKNPFAPPSAVGCFSPGYLRRQQTFIQREEITGGNLWPKVRLSLQPLLADSDAWVTILLDFYGLPDGFPGLSGLPSLPGSALDAVRHVEGAFPVTMGSPARFIPFIALHGFEAWYFANPVKVAEFFGTPSVAETMEQASREVGGPKNIHQG